MNQNPLLTKLIKSKPGKKKSKFLYFFPQQIKFWRNQIDLRKKIILDSESDDCLKKSNEMVKTDYKDHDSKVGFFKQSFVFFFFSSF